MRIVVCVGGSIAAWKACDLVSKLVQADHRVDVVMTETAERFVGPVSFAALTHRPVFTQGTWFDGTAAGPADHLQVTEEADLLVVAPCTANLIGRFAGGLADEIVSTTWMGAACPRLIAPAMHHRMWAAERLQANVAVLRAEGVQIIGPASGYLAEGDEGPGRMSEPATILEAIGRSAT